MNNKRANAISGRRRAARNALKQGADNKGDRPETHSTKSVKDKQILAQPRANDLLCGSAMKLIGLEASLVASYEVDPSQTIY